MKKISTATMTKIGLLSAISFLLMLFEVQIPIFPQFLKLDLSDLPAVIGAMAMGPAAGVFITLIKNLLDLTKTTSGGIGQFANFIIGSALVIPIGVVYQRRRTNQGYILGAACGTLTMIIVACLANYFILIPMYTRFTPIEKIINMAQAINGAVVNIQTLILFSIAPFNLLKGACISCVGYVLFNALKPVLMSDFRRVNA